jgi:anti-sigma-K factor RskA
MNADDIDVMAGEYVLGTLDDAERRRVRARLDAGDEAFVAAVARWQERLVPLTEAVEPAPVPAALWARIETSIGSEAGRAARSVPVPAPLPWWQRLGFWRGFSALATAASIVLAVMLATRPDVRVVPRYVVVLATPDTSTPGLLVEAVDERSIKLIPLATFTVPEDRVLELWTHPEGQPVVSLGLVTPGRMVAITLDDLPPLAPGQPFAVSLEPPGGSPTGQPTGPVRFKGQTIRAL